MYKNALSKSQEGVGFVKGGVIAVAGGGTAGVIWSKFGDGTPGSARIGDTKIEIDVAIGVVCIGAAAMGYGASMPRTWARSGAACSPLEPRR